MIIQALCSAYILAFIAAKIHEAVDKRRFEREQKDYNVEIGLWVLSKVQFDHCASRIGWYYDAPCDQMVRGNGRLEVKDFALAYDIPQPGPRPIPPLAPVQYLGVFLVKTRKEL